MVPRLTDGGKRFRRSAGAEFAVGAVKGGIVGIFWFPKTPGWVGSARKLMRYEFILFWVSILIAVAGVAICLREDLPVHPGSGELLAPGAGADAGNPDGGTGRWNGTGR